MFNNYSHDPASYRAWVGQMPTELLIKTTAKRMWVQRWLDQLEEIRDLPEQEFKTYA